MSLTLIHPTKIFIAVLLIFAGSTLRAAWDFTTIQQRADNLYGPASPEGGKRIDAWQQLLMQQRNKSESEQLTAVNLFFNQKLHYREDSDIWNNIDYWATPIESLRKGEADCEDYAIAKYFTLRQLGVSGEKLRITYVKAIRLNRAHMVLTWYETPNAIPVVLDSLTNNILPATQRADLLPVYSFNDSGLWLPGSQNNKRVGDSKHLSRWQDVLKKMREEGFPIDE
ncbi:MULTISPECIES: cysteine protease LapG [Buttiauxella]|uniref:cysteine protease LapG n=1 Tax=Buttiauxella TaxID=82976 RepID=UPI00105DAF80|nr:MULTISPECIES: transglutaminase-like cysteine peptidase [Buttiauxella]MCE0827394.1 transglutaminase-like cysteine peptidase [Buttiauxella ferragutiae]TDN52926.1 transglutaminase-like cysteine proteinase BTLCP [Buttiauxella sp. JUb87]UNK62145.1 transglutaminase-like cysteine peptidase [Buttiauxella ferragutiae]